MSRLFAIEWDAAQARVATGRKRVGGGLILERAFTVDLPQPAAGGTEPTGKEIGQCLARAFVERGLPRGEALVAVGRASIELRFLSLPPMPPEELPDSVRLQAVRQFTTLGEDWPVDFVSLETNRDGGINVLAAAISPALVTQIQETCNAAHLTCSRLVLRPFAAAAIVKKLAADGTCRLTIDFLGEEADLSVLAGDKLVFPRTVRLPSGANAETLARALVAEVRRTVVAAQNQLGGRRVEQVVVFGDSAHHDSLRTLLAQELSLEGGVELLDPFSVVEQSDDLRAHPPRNPGTFAPVLGMLLDEAAANPPGIDFLHPRKRPAPPNRRRLFALAGGAAAALFLAICVYVTLEVWRLNAQIASLQSERNYLDKKNKAGKTIRSQTQKVDQFAASDIPWLEELRVLSERAPPAETIRAEGILAGTRPTGGGLLSMDVVAAGPEEMIKLEEALRDERHTVQNNGGKTDEKLSGLKFRFREDVIIPPSDSAAPAQTAVPAASSPQLPAKKSTGVKRGNS